mmetsp:Transcript_21049/g.47714  ORF Transcript_21049/g.47714 Transcript_21049/m.47714 type:complete len:217 (+) Transcript_21049:2113-2763(+)
MFAVRIADEAFVSVVVLGVASVPVAVEVVVYVSAPDLSQAWAEAYWGPPGPATTATDAPLREQEPSASASSEFEMVSETETSLAETGVTGCVASLTLLVVLRVSRLPALPKTLLHFFVRLEAQEVPDASFFTLDRDRLDTDPPEPSFEVCFRISFNRPIVRCVLFLRRQLGENRWNECNQSNLLLRPKYSIESSAAPEIIFSRFLPLVSGLSSLSN